MVSTTSSVLIKDAVVINQSGNNKWSECIGWNSNNTDLPPHTITKNERYTNTIRPSKMTTWRFCALHLVCLTEPWKDDDDDDNSQTNHSARNVVSKRNHVNIFYHIHRVAAHIAKLDLGCAYGIPILEDGEVTEGQWLMVPFKRAMLISYRLSIVTTVLSLTIRPQFASECLQHPNQQGWVTLGQNLRKKGWPM